ncbi:MAG: hypothetical protein O3A78_12590 [Nitrospinae bacterium]|nr:hypothetical protein [Nitrospinota bacterium]MDA1110625.1 hypothetical protein [Nitrospinota bacterium]
MNSTATKQAKVSNSPSRPLKETLWNLFGILFYITVAVGAVYHLIPLFNK